MGRVGSVPTVWVDANTEDAMRHELKAPYNPTKSDMLKCQADDETHSAPLMQRSVRPVEEQGLAACSDFRVKPLMVTRGEYKTRTAESKLRGLFIWAPVWFFYSKNARHVSRTIRCIKPSR